MLHRTNVFAVLVLALAALASVHLQARAEDGQVSAGDAGSAASSDVPGSGASDSSSGASESSGDPGAGSAEGAGDNPESSDSASNSSADHGDPGSVEASSENAEADNAAPVSEADAADISTGNEDHSGPDVTDVSPVNDTAFSDGEYSDGSKSIGTTSEAASSFGDVDAHAPADTGSGYGSGEGSPVDPDSEDAGFDYEAAVDPESPGVATIDPASPDEPADDASATQDAPSPDVASSDDAVADTVNDDTSVGAVTDLPTDDSALDQQSTDVEPDYQAMVDPVSPGVETSEPVSTEGQADDASATQDAPSQEVASSDDVVVDTVNDDTSVDAVTDLPTDDPALDQQSTDAEPDYQAMVDPVSVGVETSEPGSDDAAADDIAPAADASTPQGSDETADTEESGTTPDAAPAQEQSGNVDPEERARILEKLGMLVVPPYTGPRLYFDTTNELPFAFNAQNYAPSSSSYKDGMLFFGNFPTFMMPFVSDSESQAADAANNRVVQSTRAYQPEENAQADVPATNKAPMARSAAAMLPAREDESGPVKTASLVPMPGPEPRKAAAKFGEESLSIGQPDISRTTGKHKRDQDLALAAVAGGKVMPLKFALQRISDTFSGKVIDVALEQTPSRTVYWVKLRTPDGAIRNLRMDARTGIFAGQDGF